MLQIELDALGYRLEQAIVSQGARLDKMMLFTKREGLIIVATVNGRSAAVRVFPGSTLSYLNTATYLMRECQAGVEEIHPQDADVLALHEGVKSHGPEPERLIEHRDGGLVPDTRGSDCEAG